MSLAFTFPGQGSQTVGMGQELANAFSSARMVFEEVDDALSQKLSHLMWNGPQEDLTLTENAQPALMAASLVAMRALKAEFDVDVTAADFVAGHSLGEYSALAAAGVISLSDTARLLKTRGQAMQKAVPVGVGAMAALLGASPEQAEEACAAATVGVCQIANDNAVGQVVISGEKAAVEAAIAKASDMGIRKAMMLPVSAPFHCSLMQPAADVMADALSGVSFQSPAVPVVCNVTAAAETDPDTLRSNLVSQVTGRVRWRESILNMYNDMNVDTFVEPGAGKVLTQMLRRIDKGTSGTALNTPEDLEAFAKEIKG